MPKLLERCRICGNANLITVLDLGEQVLTGVFPRSKNQNITKGPLQLVKCHNNLNGNNCGLLQLAHNYDLNEMYGENYGYRSGLNASMVRHLHSKVKRILSIAKPTPGDLILDIGSNDSTTLQAYPPNRFKLVGIDPSGSKFSEYYPDYTELIADYFSLETYQSRFGEQKARVVTSFSMFYDLESPLVFMREIRDILHPEGVWVFEQSYMPTMLERNAYDTICHEHLEYYALKQIKWMADNVGLRIIDVEFNDINGGSFSIIAAHNDSSYPPCPSLEKLIQREEQIGLNTLAPYISFADRVKKNRQDLITFLQTARSEGRNVVALGASTKGNVVLQYCGITEKEISYIGEVNPDKFNCYTPGSLLPIISEEAVLSLNPDYVLIMPWHFRDFFMSSSILNNKKLVFALPSLEVRSP